MLYPNQHSVRFKDEIMPESRFVPSFRSLSVNTTALGFFLEFLSSLHDSILTESVNGGDNANAIIALLHPNADDIKDYSILMYFWLDVDHVCQAIHSHCSENPSKENLLPPHQSYNPDYPTTEAVVSRLQELEASMLTNAEASNQLPYLSDVRALYSKYFLLPVHATTNAILSHHLKITLLDSIINHSTNHKLHLQILQNCQSSVESILLDKYCHYLNSIYHVRYQLQLLRSSNEEFSLNDILYYDKLLCLFNEFLQRNGKDHLCLSFYLTVDGFESHMTGAQLNGSGAAELDKDIKEDALRIYNMFVFRESPTAIHLLESQEAQIIDKMCSENGDLDPMCFHLAKQSVHQYLQQKYLAAFFQSNDVREFIVEITNIAKSNQSYPADSAIKSNSDCHSDSISVRSEPTSLSAAADPSLHLNKSHSFSRGSHASQFFDEYLMEPDKLWQRQKNGSLLFGYVDDMGQFHSEIAQVRRRQLEEGQSSSSALPLSFTNIFKRRQPAVNKEVVNRSPLEVAADIVHDVWRVNGETASRLCSAGRY